MPQLTAGQKYTLRWVGPYEVEDWHSNGDVTVRLIQGAQSETMRIAKDGMVLKRISSSGTEKKAEPRQSSWSEFGWGNISEDLTQSLKTPEPKKSKPKKGKDYTYVPYSYSAKTVCQDNPECCKPREIHHVAWDADQTIWNLPGTAAGVTGRLKKVDDDTVLEYGRAWSSGPGAGFDEFTRWNIKSFLSPEEKDLLVGLSDDEEDFLLEQMAAEHNALRHRKEKEPAKDETVRTTIKLLPTFRQTLDELEKRGITSSIISLNTPGSVKRIIKEFGLEDRFIEIRDSYENKGTVFKQITKKFGICPCESIFVNDTRHNVQDVSDACALGLQIGHGKDIKEPIEVLNYIKE